MKGVPCSIQKNHYGYLVISDFDNQDCLVTMKYLYYTKREAIKMFKEHLKNVNSQNNELKEMIK
jgi:uncharacterized protein YfcZ (UPF0381/DUF406 family)